MHRRARLEGRVAARPERAADELAVEPRRRARDRDHLVVAAAGRAWPRTASACTGGAGRGRSSTSRPSRRSRPRTSRRPGRTPARRPGRSWVTRITVRPSSWPSVVAQVDEQLEDLRLHHHVERRRRLVGEQHLRRAGERHRDRRPLPHAARELVRVPVGPVARDADELEQLAAPAPAPPCRSASPCSSIGSAIWSPIVFTGLKAFIAPWKTIAMSFQRCGLIDVLAAREDVLAVEHAPCPTTRAFGGSSPIIARIVVVLPQPDSPTSPIRSPSRSSKLTPCTACSSPPPGRSNQTCRSSTRMTGCRRSLGVPPSRRAAAAGSAGPRGGRRAAAG